MKSNNEIAMMQELSASEMKNTNGGADYLWSNTSNGLVYFGISLYNGGVSIYNLITGEKAGVKYI